MHESRYERLIRQTNWGTDLDVKLARDMGHFMKSVIEKEKLRDLDDVPTMLDKDSADLLVSCILKIDEEILQKFPVLSALNWEHAGNFSKKITPLTLINAVIKSFINEKYELKLTVEDDGTISKVWIGE